ncbi:hypothetical protein B0H16DRAFT_1805045 [Mycena metata]|uniref:CxC2-like cysteine cluster KDZ transposase-associated domain-containing protein n=1 Tax=Mycena metata TaxID=1033252 RepID=A0AAD7HA13_9AGAR|nr:hypothetical protein B0H16DRAFT_1805045 [Mycena metata]
MRLRLPLSTDHPTTIGDTIANLSPSNPLPRSNAVDLRAMPPSKAARQPRDLRRPLRIRCPLKRIKWICPDDDDPAQPQLEPSTAGVNVIKPSHFTDFAVIATDTAPNPDNGAPLIRCKDCFGDQLICATCCVDRHAENPLHRVEQWNGSHFQIVSLKSLGLRVQLGHPPRTRCPSAVQLHVDFVVLHTNGIHHVVVDACDCEDRFLVGPPEEQLLTAGWFPATDIRTRTCATFACMDLFVLSTQQSKTTIYDFYKMLEKLTDNSGGPVAYRYHAFLRMCREYPHLLMLKRAGIPRAQRRVNLPEGWENASPEDAFLYIIFLALDACFRLKRRMVSSELKDPSLGLGWSYMVESKPYRAYLLTVTDQKEMSTCSGLAALDYANTKFAKGYSSTRVGMGVCARHEFVQPNGVGDLQNSPFGPNNVKCYGLGHKAQCKILWVLSKNHGDI